MGLPTKTEHAITATDTLYEFLDACHNGNKDDALASISLLKSLIELIGKPPKAVRLKVGPVDRCYHIPVPLKEKANLKKEMAELERVTHQSGG